MEDDGDPARRRRLAINREGEMEMEGSWRIRELNVKHGSGLTEAVVWWDGGSRARRIPTSRGAAVAALRD
jgi:hypothetical protein